MKMWIAVAAVIAMSGVTAFILWRKNHEKIAIALSLAAIIAAVLARPIELGWDQLSDDSTSWRPAPQSSGPAPGMPPGPSSDTQTTVTIPEPAAVETPRPEIISPRGWKVTYPSDFRLADRWGSDFDSSDPTFNSGVASEGGRQESADLRYVALPASSEAFIDNNNNPSVGLKAVNEGSGVTKCSTEGGYVDRVDVRRYPYVCLRTTGGSFVHFHANAYNRKEVNLSDIEIMRR